MRKYFGLFCVLVSIIIVIIFSFKSYEYFSQIDGLKQMWNQKPEFQLGQWENNKFSGTGYCGPDWNKINKNDNVEVRCVGNGNMSNQDCCTLKEMGQICGVNRDTWETYDCHFYEGQPCNRCSTQNSQY